MMIGTSPSSRDGRDRVLSKLDRYDGSLIHSAQKGIW